MSFMLDSTHTSQTEDGRIIARNVSLPPPPNVTGDRGYPLRYSDWPYETVFKHGNHLRIVDAAFILREQRLCEALGVRRCRAYPRDLDNWSRDVTTFLRYHVGRSPTDRGDRRHSERYGAGLSLDMGGGFPLMTLPTGGCARRMHVSTAGVTVVGGYTDWTRRTGESTRWRGRRIRPISLP